MVGALTVHIVVGSDQFKIEGPGELYPIFPSLLAQWFDALALTKRIDALAHPLTGELTERGLRLTLEDTPPSR